MLYFGHANIFRCGLAMRVSSKKKSKVRSDAEKSLGRQICFRTQPIKMIAETVGMQRRV